MLSLRVHRLIDPRLSLSVTGHTGLLTGLCVYVCGIDAFTFLLKCIFVSVYECAPIYIYTPTYNIYVCAYTCSDVSRSACMFTCIHKYAYVSTWVCMHVYADQ